jgi:hypothetical protein
MHFVWDFTWNYSRFITYSLVWSTGHEYVHEKKWKYDWCSGDTPKSVNRYELKKTNKKY